MPIKDKRKPFLEPDFKDSEDSNSSRRFTSDAKRIRRVHPLGMRVLVRVLKDGNMTDTGLYLPEGAKQTMDDSVLAEVVEVASALDSNTQEETNVSGIPNGALVLISKTAGVRVPWDDDLRLVETRDVLAVVDEISLV
jgi:co-chaperonin GroES (HSP10)